MDTQEIAQSIRSDINGEVLKAINSSIAETWPGLNLHSLIAAPSRNNSTQYLHPESMKPVATYTKHPEHILYKKETVKISHWGRGPSHRIVRSQTHVPSKFVYTIYSRAGHIASLLEGQYAELSDNTKTPYVTNIKDFYPVDMPQQKFENGKDKDYVITTKRGNARRAKHYQRLLADLSQEDERHEAWFKGFVVRSNMSRAAAQPRFQTREKSATDNGANGIAYIDPSNAPQGELRRERSFREIDRIRSMYHVTRGQFTIEGRRNKDRVNHRNGNYSVTQHSGNNFAVTLFDPDGRRINLTSYNGKGEVMKELGADARTLAPRSQLPNRPPPPDKIVKQRLMADAIQRDAHAELHHFRTQGLEIA